MMSKVLTLVAGVVAWQVISELVSYAHRAREHRVRDVVDLAGEDSFPASDPPPWTAGRASIAEV